MEVELQAIVSSPIVYWELNSGPSEEEKVLLATQLPP